MRHIDAPAKARNSIAQRRGRENPPRSPERALKTVETVPPVDYFVKEIFNHARITPIARRPHNAPPTRDTGPRTNDRIRVPEIRLIGADGENVGVVTPARGMALAQEAGLDLVEISPNAVPPVCKIMDLGKFKYEQQKREAEARKKQKTIEVKEIKFRPGTDDHDYDVKMRSVKRFLEEGDKVKVTLRFRGREMAHQNLGMELLNRVRDEVGEAGKVESMPKLEGRQMVMMIAPR
nr:MULTISPECIES: translation initiation factor IF-3 [unclassified Paracoccus (in: a-proteobacteria)]